MDKDLAYILIGTEEIAKRTAEIGAQLDRDYAGHEPVFVGVLKGSFLFMADLVRQTTLHGVVDFMQVSSYGDRATSTTGAVKIVQDLSMSIEGRDVIIVEDILDSGVTLSYLTKLLWGRNPASIRIATLLDKPSRRQADIRADYVGFTVPDAFVVGYGLDYAEKYRNLPFIGVLKPEVYEK